MKTLLEDSVDNISVIQEIADIIIAELPDVVYQETMITISPGDIRYSMNRLADLISRHRNKPKIKRFIETVAALNVVFLNRSSDLNSENFAEYKPYTIKFFLPKIIGMNEVFDIDMRKLMRFKTGGVSVRTILMHELRHVFQHSDYPDFYSASLSGDVIDYETQPLEIDAAWHHMVASKNPKLYSSPYQFVDDVISDFSEYKKLTASQYEHYRRKTAKYFYQRRSRSQSEFIKSFVEGIYKIREYTDYQDLLKSALTGFFGEDYDSAKFSEDEKKEFAAIKYLTAQKYRQGKSSILESSDTVMNVLDDLTRAVIDFLPNVIPENSVINKIGYEIPGISKVRKKYLHSTYRQSLDHILDCNFIFVNKRMTDYAILGAQYGDLNTVVVYIAGLQKSSKAILKSDLLELVTPNGRTFEGVIFHEIRHVMQNAEYQDFYNRASNTDYQESPLEIDARWFQLLTDAGRKEFKDSSEFTNAVMLALTKEKKMSKKYQEHYRKKTLRYFFNQYQKSK